MLTGGADPMDATGTPPAGFVRLPPARRRAPSGPPGGARSGAAIVLSFLMAMGAGQTLLQSSVAWTPWRAVLPAVGVLFVFGGLGIWARRRRGGIVATQSCACERPPVWIRVIPSLAQGRRRLLGERSNEADASGGGRRAPLVEATRATRS